MPQKFSKDELYALPMEELVDFSFDERTVSVFPDMINRSVPGYGLMQSLTGLVACQYVTKSSKVYDLGCSLGASSLSVINSVNHDDYELILVDQSESMIDHCQRLLAQTHSNINFNIEQEDIRNIEIDNTSLVMLNLVLQFLPVEDRQLIINKIYAGLNKGGALLLSEKTKANENSEKKISDNLYIDFKKRSGYSELEISQKRHALENVMHIESIDLHSERLISAGFSTVMPIMQALNFVTLLAVK